MERKDVIIGLVLAVFLALAISPFASSWPDGLEKVAEDKGFLEKAQVQAAVNSPMPDYAWPGIEHEGLAASAAGLSGTLMVFLVSYALAVLLRSKEA